MSKTHVTTISAVVIIGVLSAVHLTHKAPVAKATPSPTVSVSPSVSPKVTPTPTAVIRASATAAPTKY